MNRELMELFGRLAKEPDPGLSRRWSSAAIVNNAGAIPQRTHPNDDSVWNRGFNLVLLGADRSPTHFCKCRPLDEPSGAHEGAVAERLGQLDDLRGLVPVARVLSNSRLQLLAMPFVAGDVMADRMARMRPGPWLRTIGELAELAARLTASAAAAGMIRESLPMGASRTFSEAGAGYLEYLASVGVDLAAVRVLDRVLADGGRFVPSCQHGDFWARNVLGRADGSYCVIDFERFGLVSSPMFDVFQLLRTSWEGYRAEATGGRSWLSVFESEASTRTSWRAILGKAVTAHSLAANQFEAALALYLIEALVWYRRRSVDPLFWAGIERDVKLVAEKTTSGKSLLA